MSRFVWVAVGLLLVTLVTSLPGAEAGNPDAGMETHGQTDATIGASVGGLPLKPGAEEVRPGGGVDEATVRQTIAALDLMTEHERQQLLPWLFSAIAQQSDAHIRGDLTQALDEELAQLAAQAGESTTPQQGQGFLPEEIPGAAQGQESFETLVRRQQEPLPSEQELRKEIEALTLDPAKPEIALTRAMEIAGVIDRIEDQELQATLRRILEDKVLALQADL